MASSYSAHSDLLSFFTASSAVFNDFLEGLAKFGGKVSILEWIFVVLGSLADPKS